uniref:Uncharacterized protein n=1 Tax=Ditylenchus dipsaci TaxID=166011 RepID=A0A915DF04_9BILA
MVDGLVVFVKAIHDFFPAEHFLFFDDLTPWSGKCKAVIFHILLLSFLPICSLEATAGTPLGGHGNDVGPNDSKLNKWTMPRSSNQEPSNYNGFKTPFSEPFWAPDSFHQDPHFPVGKIDFSAPPELHNRRANPTLTRQIMVFSHLETLHHLVCHLNGVG